MQFLQKEISGRLLLFFRLVLIIVLSVGTTYAQTDTLSLAKKMRDGGKIKEAWQLLSGYRKTHPNDLNANWLAAQTAFWMHHFKDSREIYETAMAANPKNYYLKLDYGKVLGDMGAFEQSSGLLHTYLKFDSTNTDALTTLAKITYWEGDFNQAADKIKDILKQHPDNRAASDLYDEILSARSPWIRLDGNYSSDDQPLQTLTPELKGSVFLSPLAALHLAVSTPFFIKDGITRQALSVEVGNRSNFFKQGLKTDIALGAVQFPFKNTIAFKGNISLTETIAKYLELSAAADRRPYFYSRSSIDTTILQNNLSVSAAWNNKRSVNGIAGFLVSTFPDNNSLQTFYTTLFSPELKAGLFKFQLGYGYNYSTSNNNRFVPVKTLSQINLNPAAVIEGNYIPYFTPNQQQIHSIVGIAVYQPQKNIQVGATGNYGIYATTQDPYFTELKTGSTVTGWSRSYSSQTFTPVEISGYIMYQPTKKLFLRAAYQYHQTFFYTTQNLSFTVKVNFWHEKKK
jgi:hypothetical protein